MNRQRELTCDYVSARLLGAGVHERNVDTSGTTWRIMHPEAYLDPERGFPDLLTTPWILTYRADGYFVATPEALWWELLGRLRHELCTVGHLPLESFKELHEVRGRKIWLDKRNRWPIHEHLTKYLHPDADDKCKVVFQTREATIEIRSLSRYHQDQRQAEVAAERLRNKSNGSDFPAKSP